MSLDTRRPECGSELQGRLPLEMQGGSGDVIGATMGNIDPIHHPESTNGVVIKREGSIVVVTLADEAFLRARDFVIEQYTARAVANIGWSERFARKMAVAGFEIHDELGNPMRYSRSMIPMVS